MKSRKIECQYDCRLLLDASKRQSQQFLQKEKWKKDFSGKKKNVIIRTDNFLCILKNI